jgi:hypothetical protein
MVEAGIILILELGAVPHLQLPPQFAGLLHVEDVKVSDAMVLENL